MANSRRTDIRTLLVDDNQEFREHTARFLAAEGTLDVVGSASTGYEALEQVAMLQPQLVLMDWQMPEMNGLEATRALKSKMDAPLVIMLTQHDTPKHRAMAQAVGADGFLAKSELGSQLRLLIDGVYSHSVD